MAYKFQLGAYTASGSLVQEGAIEAKSGNGGVGSITADVNSFFKIGTAELSEVDCLKLDAVTNGTVENNKCLVASAANGISGTGILQYRTIKCENSDDKKVAQLGSNAQKHGEFLLYADDGTLLQLSSSAGNLSGSGFLELGGQITAAQGLTIGGSAVKFSNLTVATVKVDEDSFYFLDNDGFMKSDSMADYATAIAGTGIVAEDGVLSAIGAPIDVTVISSAGTISVTGSEGLNVFTTNLANACDFRLPTLATVGVGDSVSIKARNAALKPISILPATDEEIDSVANKSIVLESDDAAVKFIRVDGSTWALV